MKKTIQKAACALVLRIGKDLLWIALLDDAPLVNEDDAIRH